MMALIAIAVVMFFVWFLYLASVRNVCKAPEASPSERDETAITIAGGLVTGSIVTIGAMVPGLGNAGKSLLMTFGVNTPVPWVTVVVNLGLAVYVLGYIVALGMFWEAWKKTANATPLIRSSAKAYLAVAVTSVAALLGVQLQAH